MCPWIRGLAACGVSSVSVTCLLAGQTCAKNECEAIVFELLSVNNT